MNHKLFKACLAGTAAVALVAGGTTFAAWSDYDEVLGNTTAAGHLQLDLNSTGTISNVGGTAIAPGESRTIDFFVASADLDGVPDADLSMSVLNLQDLENGCGTTNSEQDLDSGCADAGNAGEFSQQAYMRIRYTDPAPVADIDFSNNTCSAPGGYVNSIGYSPASSNDATVFPRLNTLGSSSELGTLQNDTGVCVRIDLGLDSNATNIVQSDSSTFDLRFDLEQVFLP